MSAAAYEALFPLAPYSVANSSAAHPHTVQFYRNDSFLIEQLSQFITPAIKAGSAVLLIATKAHRDALYADVRKCGPDFALAVAKRRFLLLDAEETLARFMVKGQPDPVLFERIVGDRLMQVASAAEGPNPQTFAFGEMVACLWSSGKREAALRLEVLWNQLAEKYAFQLLCAYPLHLFSHPQDQDDLQRICALHTHVIPPERNWRSAGLHDRLHSVLAQMQKSRSLDRETRERKKLQQVLQEINPPLDNVANTIHLVTQQPELSEDLRRQLSTVRQELGRVAHIVKQAVATGDD